MTLDLSKIASQIGDMALKIKSGSKERQEHLKCALNKLCEEGLNIEKLKRKVASARTPWPIAGLYEGLSLRYSAPQIPEEYTVLATDGSHIDVDRHRAARCYLINIGAVNLHYGASPSAQLESLPYLFSDDKDLVIKNEQNKHRQQLIEGALLDARRTVEECKALARMASELLAEGQTLALMDGSLVLFSLESFPDFVTEDLLVKGFLKELDELKQLSSSRRLTLASYISLPRSMDVANLIKIALCPQENVDCERFCTGDTSACEAVAGINDRLLFSSLLEVGERSALFTNPSIIVEKHYRQHRVFFFYLKLEDEIARIEIPEWVARRQDLVEMTHALILDQCLRGQGYPVALSEAHEKAVVTGADREEFWGLVEEALVKEKVPTYTSIKNRSKRTRWL